MSMFTLAVSCLTTFNLPWFMNRTFQVPMQYCSLQDRTLLPSMVTSTTGCCFCFGCVSSFFLELFLHWSPVAYWAPTDLGSSSLSVLSFSFSYCSWDSQGKKVKWFAIPFSRRIEKKLKNQQLHILSELSIMTTTIPNQIRTKMSLSLGLSSLQINAVFSIF